MENISCDDLNPHNIPQDVLIQILVLLPVISLLRFKSVCKSWRAIIQSSLFIHLHLNTTTNNNNNNNFGTFIYQTSDHRNKAFMLSSSAAAGDDDDDDDDEFEKLLKLKDIGFPSRYKFSPNFYDIFMVGSCNGLICIHDTKGKEVSLWNPATRQFRILPESLAATTEGGIPVVSDPEQDYVGFGYDVKTNDYKVVQISHFRPHNNMSDEEEMSDEDMSDEDTLGVWFKECIFRVQVYSLATDSWRLLEEGINSFFPAAFPRQLGGCNHGVYLNGSYYFLGTDPYIIDSERSLMLLSFDFTKEIFTTTRTIQQLPCAYDCLTSFGEKQLAVFTKIMVKEDESDDFETYDIWVLNEHHHGGGVKEEEEEEPLWTKLHSMRLNRDGDYNRRPMSISNNGEFALISADGDRVIDGVHVYNCSLLQLFNLVTQQVKKEFRPGWVRGAEVYKQSLVWIGGGNDTTADRVIGAEM